MVVIVVDPDFGDRLADLAGGIPVWIADTPCNRSAAERFWRHHAGRTEVDGVTTFVIDASRRPVDWCGDILDVVDIHHDLSAPGRSAVHVIGCRVSPDLTERVKAFGLTHITETSDGFIAHRLG